MANILYEDIFTSPLLAKPKQKRKEKVMESVLGCDGEQWSQPDARHKLALSKLAFAGEQLKVRALLIDVQDKRIAELEAENAALRAALPVPTGLRQVAELVRCCMSEEVEG